MLVAINETFLDKSVGIMNLSGYELVSRRDRDSYGGGIALFCLTRFFDTITHLDNEADYERSWHTLHSNLGPILVCVWYRPPYAETSSIIDLQVQLDKYQYEHIGTIIVGDLNVHHLPWLRFSTGTSVAGLALHDISVVNGLEQCVKGPTREGNLLDLVLTDLDSHTGVEILPRISDHNLLLITLALSMPSTAISERIVWDYSKANWVALRKEFAETDWTFVEATPTDEAAVQLLNVILEACARHIPSRSIHFTCPSHPWINERCLDLLAQKTAAEGTDACRAKAEECSRGMLEEYFAYIGRVKEKLQTLRPSSAAFWKLSKKLLHKPEAGATIPALKRNDGTWARSPAEKATEFASHFQTKWVLPSTEEVNDFSEVDSRGECMVGFLLLRTRNAISVLKKLREKSATGPDELGTIVLRRCAKELGPAFCKLCRSIVSTGRWPEVWIEHRICPLHKKKSKFLAKHYRGIQLTSQLSKAAERFIGRLFLPYLASINAYGENQFAYTLERGARDALLFIILSWLLSIANGKKIALYCSDVAGAFDKVDAQRLVVKLRALGIHPQLVAVFMSWLRKRRARVVVSGCSSEPFVMENMIYQGTVWGPPFWNCYYADAKKGIAKNNFVDVVFADDLNAFKQFPNQTSHEDMMAELDQCQSDLHAWGRANRVEFDAGKESKHIISKVAPTASEFHLLGVDFDCKLLMHSAVHSCVVSASWKLKALLRTRRFYTTGDLLRMFKSHILSFIEYRTPALMHASSSVLKPLDHILERFLNDLGVLSLDALLAFNLAPLSTRRDMSALGVIHRAILRKGPSQFHDLFLIDAAPPRRSERRGHCVHDRQVLDPYEQLHRDYLNRSVFGYIWVYNRLPERAVHAPSVKAFQSHLQDMLKDFAARSASEWELLFSARVPRNTSLLRLL